MKIGWILALLCCNIPSFALHGAMEKATVNAMRKVPCVEIQSSGGGGMLSGFAGVPGGTVDECVEYELRTNKVSYIVRPHRTILLMLGADVSIKLAESELLLQIREGAKEIRCVVISMSLRSEAEKREGNRPYPRNCYAESGRQIPCPE